MLMANAHEKALAVCRQIKDANASRTCALCHADFLDFVHSVAGVSLDNERLTQLLDAAGCSSDGRVQLEEFMNWVFDGATALPSVDRPRKRVSTGSLISNSPKAPSRSLAMKSLTRSLTTSSLDANCPAVHEVGGASVKGEAIVDVTGMWAVGGEDGGGFFLELKQDPLTHVVVGTGSPVGSQEVTALGQVVGDELVYEIQEHGITTTFTLKLVDDGCCLEGRWAQADGRSGVHKMMRGPPLAEVGDVRDLEGMWCLPSSGDINFVPIEQPVGNRVRLAIDPSLVMTGNIEDSRYAGGGASLTLSCDAGYARFSIAADGTYMDDPEDMQRWYRVAC